MDSKPTQIAQMTYHCERNKVSEENARLREGFVLLWRMAEDYKTPWVNETLRYNPYFASLYEELVRK